MTIVAVTDTGPLIHLAEIDALELLSIPERLLVPDAVLSELEAGDAPEKFGDIEYTVAEPDVDVIDTGGLDPGESDALALSAERNTVLLTDDLAARERAIELDIEVHGSIGIVVLGYSRGRLDRDGAVSLMRDLQRKTSLFVTDAVVEQGIEMLDCD